MAKFLDTRKAASELSDLMRNADTRLVLMSPYLKLSKDFRELLSFRNSKDKVTTIVFGKQELNPEQLEFLRSLRFVALKYKEELHAKCYLNETKMIITSLNLYEFSMANNKEMGVLIDKNDPADQQLLQDALGEVDFILETSQPFNLNSTAESKSEAPRTDSTKRAREQRPAGRSAGKSEAKEAVGFCLRCAAEIPFDPERPYCASHYKAWAKWSNPDYEDPHCHACGEDVGATMKKPLCRDCYKERT